MLFVNCARLEVCFCTLRVLSTEIEFLSSFFPSLIGTSGANSFGESFTGEKPLAESLSLRGPLGSAGGGAISAGLKSGTGGFDCFREKNDLQVPDLDLRKCGSLRGAAEAVSNFAGATSTSSFLVGI